jgi:hypothetical protein
MGQISGKYLSKPETKGGCQSIPSAKPVNKRESPSFYSLFVQGAEIHQFADLAGESASFCYTWVIHLHFR